MPNNIYPDNSLDRFNTRYQRLKALPSDLFVSKQGQLVMGDPGTGGGGEPPGGLGGGGGVVHEVIPNPIIPPIVNSRAPILIFLDRFRVMTGGTMEEGDDTYTNNRLPGYEFLVLSNGIEITQAVIAEQRYVVKTEETQDQLFFNGGMTDQEVIEIYLKFIPFHDSIIDWFVVDAPDAPMVDGQTTYINTLLENSKFIMYSNEIAIHQLDDNAGERYATKTLAGDTITVNGGVTHNEIIHIYKVF